MDGWVVGMWACWVGRLVGRRSEAAGRLMVLGWVGLVGGRRQAAAAAAAAVAVAVFVCSYHHFSSQRVQRWWWDERGRKMNTFFYWLVVGTCVCREEKKVIFLLFVSPGGGGGSREPARWRKGELEVWISPFRAAVISALTRPFHLMSRGQFRRNRHLYLTSHSES